MKRHFSNSLSLILILLLINTSLTQIKVFPDHYLESDAAYSSSSLYLTSDVKERQIYKLGYFTTDTNSFKSYKFGYIYNPDNYCKKEDNSNGIAQGTGIYTIFGIKDDKNTREKNFSEELGLIKNYCTGKQLFINTPFPTLHNTGYLLKYKLSITNDYTLNADLTVNIGLRMIQTDTTVIDNDICQFEMKGQTPDWFKMTIKSKLSSSNKITMIFICENEDDSHSFDVNTDDKLQFILGTSTNTFNIYISFYQVILEDSSSSYFLSYNDNKIIRTFNGMEKCDNNYDETKCLIGYSCNSNRECQICDSSCFECENPGSCKSCNVYTDVDNTNTGTTCDINYIDLSNFDDFDIDVPLPNNEFHERSTMGFWMFISDISKARTGNSNIYHISLQDRYVISIIPNEIATSVYCHAYEDLYRSITTDTIFESHYSDRESEYVIYRNIPTDAQFQYINSRDLSGQWFHVSCGLSFDHKLYHLTTVVNGENSYIEKALRHENLYYDSDKNEYIENDVFFRHVVKYDEKLHVQFRNFGKAGTKVFLKYFLLFQEYIPPTYLFMYYDFYQASDDNTNYQLILQIKFDKLESSSSGYSFYYRDRVSNNNIKAFKTLALKAVDLVPPKNFKLLVLSSFNNAYTYIDCNTNNKKTITGPGKINWDNNKPLFCNNYLNTKDDICMSSEPCGYNNNQYIVYPGIENSRGNCDFLCSGPMTCQNSADGTNFCKDQNKDIYNLFYSCEDKKTKYYLQYSSFYGPGTITIGSLNLESYIIEIWYYPDFFLSDTNRQGKFYYPDSLKNYVFYSNVAQAYFLHSESKKLKVEDEGSTYTSPYYHPYEWNKLVFYGKKNTTDRDKYFIINNLVNDYIRFKQTSNWESLSYITFFSTQDGNNWATGYYRDLRIWDGNTATPELTVLYDNYYTSGNGRISSLLRYYPLTNEYIAGNTITEIIGVNNPTVSEGLKKLRRYNFSSKFDFIRTKYPSLGYYLIADATAPKPFKCESGCLRCWNSGSNCYECNQGYLLTIERSCIQTSGYYFKSPCDVCEVNPNAVLKIENGVYNINTSPITVTFWIKPLGFVSTDNNQIDVVFYSEVDLLRYNPNTGLSLISEGQTISSYKDFKENIGKWIYISLSYYKEQTDTENFSEVRYFPQMINFEVNGKALKLTRNPTQLRFDRFTIPKNLYGFLCNIRYYHEYLVGAYGFATNNGNLISPFSIPQPVKTFLVPGSSESNCKNNNDFLLNNGDQFSCAGDRDRLFDTFATSFNNYIEIQRGFGQPKECKLKRNNEEAFCLNACKGNLDIDCTCMNRNYNSQMLVKNADIIYCKTLSYINFSKAKPIKIKVKTAQETKKFTLQFWMFFYNYKDGNFRGSTFNWDGHNKIIVFKNNANKYMTYCNAYTVENKIVKELKSSELELNHKKWNFISCSVNYEERRFYLNLNNEIEKSGNDNLDGPRLDTNIINPSEPPDSIVNNEWTFLEIVDNTNLKDWGYLFYRQIHLWKYAYFNAEFLSRVNILTPAKFPYLLHSWDTHFKGYKDGEFNNNFIVKDICGYAPDFTVTKVDTLGFNYIKEEDALKDVNLCTEDGEYYDLYDPPNCLPFADLGLLDDFTFTDIPFSYTGTYSMAFWIFFEDASTIGSGIHFKWERHLQITVIKFTQLQGYCLPQGYYSDDIPNAQFSEKLTKIPNYIDNTLVTTDQSESGVWIWVLCSVSNYAGKYFLKGNGPSITRDLTTEDLYYSDLTAVGQPVKNVYPYHYYMSEVENGVSQTSKLYIEGLANDKRIYIRDLFLFKDFIPEKYAEAFKNVDLSKIDEEWMLQSMVFVCNFADFNINKMTLTYYVINQQNTGQTSSFTKTKRTVKLYRSSKISSTKTFELCSNFAFIKITRPYSGTLCKVEPLDEKPNTDFYYCNDEKTPIVCRGGRYLTITADGDNVECKNQCNDQNYMRVPGAPFYSGICSIEVPEIDFKGIEKTASNSYSLGSLWKCSDQYNQISYRCYNKDLDEKSAFFFSRCYNQPNFYGEISNKIKEKLPNGYFYEFWFKLDKVQILNHCETTAKQEYILFSTPHSIYLDLSENKYYYKIIDTIYSSTLDGINNYEWNKIVIKTTLGITLGQNVYVYINFDIDNIKATILNIPSSIKMQLQYISFCSKEANGDCTPAGAADVTWGSAYYRNIRVWELYSSSIYSIQDFNIEIFTDIPLSLKLYYPLKISKMNSNKLEQIIDNIDDIIVVHEESQNFKSLDPWGFYNYATNFDWGVEDDMNKERFISSMNGIYITSQECGANCERCYTNANTNCYKCKVGFVLKGMTCVNAQGKTYLKIPNERKDKIEFNIDYLGDNAKPVKDYSGITITFYMKFEGIVKIDDSTFFNILELTEKTILAYNSINAYLELYIEESSPAFQYTEFYKLIGQWIPYSIAIYIGQTPIPERYPYMFTFSVNKEDIPFVNGYTLPNSLNRIDRINLGKYAIALFADLRIYNTFIQGSFGQAISNDKGVGLILAYPLMGSTAADCISPSQYVNSIEPICVTDYTDYIGKSCGMDTTKYFDLSIPGEEPCASCPDYCKTKCFNPNNNQCTCDLTNGLYWLRRDKRTRQTYCEYVPGLDFSILEDIKINVPSSQTFESTIEFWIFIYSYNSETSQFKSISIEWDLHNKVKIYDIENTIYTDCYAFNDMTNENRYTEKLNLAISGYSWVYIRCGTDYISQTKTFFLNNQEALLITPDYPDRSNLLTKLKISSDATNSFGYVFLKDIKLWQQYNFHYINTQYINLIDDVGQYNPDNFKTTGMYPGLITYIKCDFNQNDYLAVLKNATYKLENLVGQDILGYEYQKTYTVERKSSFLGYNIVDPNNYGYYSDLVICGEGYVYNSENNICLEVTVTKCKYPGDISDNCISCPEENKYIYPPNGNCVNNCGPRFYPRDDINQCRACHHSCYECWGYAYNNCLSCIDDLYLVESIHECVPICQVYGLIISTNEANKCVAFEAVPILINYQEHVPIDINTFDYLIAEITKMETKLIYQRWSFDPEKTRNANHGLFLNFENGQVPFYPNNDDNLESLNVTLNHSFFQLKRSYIFTLEITSYNVLDTTKQVTRSFDFNLTMNSYPEKGDIEVIPEAGLHITTTFLIRCQNWTDDTIKSQEDFTYYFYAKEKLSNEVILLQDWSTNNEITTTFALEKDSLPFNTIDIYCIVRDNYMAETEVKKTITVLTQFNDSLYKLEDSVEQYYLPDKQLSPVELLHLSEVLNSLGHDLYKVLRPSYYQSIYKPSMDKTLVVETKPECVTFDAECNDKRGQCNNLVDEFLVCRCNEGYIGTNCHIDKNGGAKLLEVYKELYSKILSTLQSEITYNEFKVMHNLFEGAKYFSEDTTFFSNQMETFLTMALNVYPKSIDNNTYEYIDLLDFYFSYEYERLNKKRVNKMYNTGLSYRDLPIDNEDVPEFREAFEYIHNELINIIHYKCNMHINTQVDYQYNSDNFYIAVKSVNPTFDEDEFFEERKANYKSYPKFMTCLNYIENTKLNNPYFQTFMIYIEYYKFPFGYDDEIYKINTGPLIEIRFLDATTGKNFDLSDCTGPNQININSPFTNYRWKEQLMEQKSLFDPRNYKSPNDAIFSDPIYINQSGYVSDDTVQQRIQKYHRRYNFSCRYYDIENMKFVDTGVVFTNFTSDTNFIQYNTTHLSRFSTFFVPNNASFRVKGRFFYVPRTELLKWKDNYKANFGFITFLIVIIAYAGLSLVLGCYDNIYFVKESLLESLKVEIVKSFLPYKSRKEREVEAFKLIPITLDPELLEEKKFGDKTKDNKRYENEDTKNDDILSIDKTKRRDLFSNGMKGNINSGDRLLKISVKNNKSNEYFQQKNNKQENIMTAGNKRDLQLDLDTKDFYSSTTGKNLIMGTNVNRLSTNEDAYEEYQRALYAYANLSLTFCEYLGKNILLRNILINPFFNINMFNPRWKKLIFFTTNVLFELLLLSIFLTNDEKALHTNMKSLVIYSFYTTLITDVFMHFMALFFQFSTRQKRRLLKLVRFKGQLIVMKEYEDMQLANNILTIIGAIICYEIWITTFYMSFAFYSVWKVQHKAYVYSFFMTVGIDFVGLDCLYELVLAIIYMQRKSSIIWRVIGEFLNRVRNHRCMN